MSRAFKLQKAALRSVKNLPYNAFTSEHFKQLGILRPPEIFEYRTLLLIYSTLKFGTNPDLFGELQSSSLFHSHSTKYCTDLVIPHFLLTKTQLRILFVGAKFWNALPQHLKYLVLFSIFDRRVKDHLLDTY